MLSSSSTTWRWAIKAGDEPLPKSKAADEKGAAPGGKRKMTPSERARHAANVRHGNENPFAQRLKQIQQRGKKGKAGGKGKAPKAPKPDKAAEQAAARAANMAAVTDALMEKDAPIGKAGLDALAAFAAGGDLDEGMAQELAKLGVVRLGEDGVPRMTPDGKRLVRAAEKGDVRAALDAAFDAGEKMGIGAAGEKLPSKAKEEADAAADADAEAAKEKEKKGGGGGGGGSAKPSEDEKAAAEAEKADAKEAERLRLKAEREADRTKRDAETEARLLAREERRAKARAEEEKRKAEEAAKQEREDVSGLLDEWEAGRTGLSYRDMRRAVRLGLGRYDDAGNFKRKVAKQ
jgi:hypothetical protein